MTKSLYRAEAKYEGVLQGPNHKFYSTGPRRIRLQDRSFYTPHTS